MAHGAILGHRSGVLRGHTVAANRYLDLTDDLIIWRCQSRDQRFVSADRQRQDWITWVARQQHRPWLYELTKRIEQFDMPLLSYRRS